MTIETSNHFQAIFSGIVSAICCVMAICLATSAYAERAENLIENVEVSITDQLKLPLVPNKIEDYDPSVTYRNNICGYQEFPMQVAGSSFPGFCAPFGACDDPEVRDSYIWDNSMDTIYLRTFWHIVRDDAGNNAFITPASIAVEMSRVNVSFAPYGLQFTWMWDFVDNTKYLNSTSFALDDTMALAHNSGPEYLDIYVSSGASGSYGNLPFGISAFTGRQKILMNPLTNLFPASSNSTTVHEIGHTLGLLHPFRGAVTGTGVPRPCGLFCAENMTTGSSDNNGDYCSDTDPQWSFNLGCVFPARSDTACGTSIPWTNIPNDNYMGYANFCRSQFSPQQVGRMHCWIRDKRNDWIVDEPLCDDSTFIVSTSNDIGGPAYQWIAADVLGAQIPLATFYNKYGWPANDDGTTGPHPIGFTFSFYDSSFTSIYIAVNGAISFTDEELNYNGFYLPGTARNFTFKTTVAPFFNDHWFNTTAAPDAGVYLYSAPTNDTLVVQWHNASNFVNGALTSFQAVLTSDGNILYQYKSVQASGLAATASVGLLEFGCNFERYYDVGAISAGPVTNSFAILFKLNDGCCVGSTGNVDADPAEVVDIADLTFLIDHLFINFPPLSCPEEGNIDGDISGAVDIADLTSLIDHLFINFPPTALCQ